MKNKFTKMAFLNQRNLSLTVCFALAFVYVVSCEYVVEAEKEIPSTKLGHIGVPTLSFEYCYSCGYKKAYEDYVAIIRDKYPVLNIEGSHYDPPGINLFCSKIIFGLKVCLILAIVSSYDVFGVLGSPTPSWWLRLLDNKIYACMMIFFVGNLLESQLVSSGAFEISLNGLPVWSKLQTGRIPAPPELFQIIDNHLRMITQNQVQDNLNFVK